MTFAEKLITLRKKKGITSKKLSELSGVSTVSLSNYERGVRTPSVIVVNKLAKALECEFEELYNLI